MRICENGIYRDMTAEEIAELEALAEEASAEEKKRPLTQREVQAMLIRQQVNTLAVDDATAYRMREFYPEWEAGVSYTEGFKFLYGGALYKVLQAHTSQEDWLPGSGTESLYARIDEQHDGTKYDPIPASRGMEYEYGKYYLDSEDGKTYKCERTGEAAGGKIVLQYLPHELVGNYFTAV